MEKISLHFPHLALLCLHCLSACLALSTTNLIHDQEALLALKAHIISDPSDILITNWTTSFSVCQWRGVTCGPPHNRVTALNVSNMNLTGTIPPQLGNLSFLVSLDLRRNSFRGELPDDLAHLHQLRVLEVSYNNLGGEIPTWLGSLQNLQQLTLGNNIFTGVIPSSISNASNLEKLSLSYNSLEGIIPKEFGNLQNLKFLTLVKNQFYGPVPREIFNISMLEVLEFSENNLSGSLPDAMCHQLQRLQRLVVHQNRLNGQIPSNFSGCSKLQVLVLFYNNFTGGIPKQIQQLETTKTLRLDHNNLKGLIPKEIGNLTMLNELDLGDNNFTGKTLEFWTKNTRKHRNNIKILCNMNLAGIIPQELGNLHRLEFLSLEFNCFSGSIPKGIFNLSTMRNFSVAHNDLSGSLPSNLCHGLPMLEGIYLDTNSFSGFIPLSISNCSQLINLDLSANKFTGPVPNSFGDLGRIQYLTLSENNLTRESSSRELSFITSLTNCKYLRYLAVNSNPLNGILPNSVGNLSVDNLFAYNCNIMGNIPDSIGNLSNLISLSLRGNLLTGPMPSTIKHLQKLQDLDLGTNNLSEVFLDDLCGLQHLFRLNMNQSQISGPIPECLGNISSLRYLSLDSNRLSSSIPAKLWNLKDLLHLDLSSNSLSGFLPPELGDLKSAVDMNFSINYFSGDIPGSIVDLQHLKSLSLANNRLQGVIPEKIGQMLSLEWLDLANNSLSGSIPTSLENISSLSYLNVSFNHLQGEIPSGGPFRNFGSESFAGNEALCGVSRFHVRPCETISSPKSSLNMVYLTILVFIGTLLIVGVMALGLRYLGCLKRGEDPNEIKLSSVGIHERFTSYELEKATDGYNERNLLGRGSFGSVYRGSFSDGRVLAIKVFNLQFERAFSSFEIECQILSNLRHRNLARVISTCSNGEFMALVLEYMPNGNLEKWLYSNNYFLDIMQRLNIMIDVGAALHYLHSGYFTTIVHCDLKPSNVLLDQDMSAHLSDFGIAKMLSHEEGMTHTDTLATLGYIAPEYGLEGMVSARCDIYSYGILLMEVFTRKKPSDELFGENLSLKDWVRFSLADALADIVDGNLLGAGDDYFTEKLEAIASIMEVALNCSKESPYERIGMGDVLAALNRIKLQLLQFHTGA